MGLLSDIVLLGTGVVAGTALGYYVLSHDMKEFPTAREQITTAVQRYQDKDVPVVIAQPENINIEYAVSPKEKFRGFLITDVKTGKQGTLIRSAVLGIEEVSVNYAPLEGKVDEARVIIPLLDTKKPDYSLDALVDPDRWGKLYDKVK